MEMSSASSRPEAAAVWHPGLRKLKVALVAACCLCASLVEISASNQSEPSRVDSTGCEHLTTDQRNFLQMALNATCPMFVAAYGRTSGVILNRQKQNLTTDQLIRRRLGLLSAQHSGQLHSFNENKRAMAALLRKLHWNEPSEEVILFQLELLLCTTLLPICTHRYASVTGEGYRTAESNQPPAAHQRQNVSSAGNATRHTYSLRPLRPCRWICDGLKDIFPQITYVTPNIGELSQTAWYQFLISVVESCGTSSSSPGQHVHCLNVSKAHGGVVEDVYPLPRHLTPANDPYIGSQSAASLPIASSINRTYSPPKSMCFNLAFNESTTTEYFVTTPDSRHWSTDVQRILYEVVMAARFLLNATADQIPLNGSLLPFAFACRSIVLSDQDIRLARSVMLPMSQIGVVLGLFAVASFLIQWTRMSKYPMPVLLYLNMSALLSSIGFSFRFYVSDERQLICHSDGSRLFNQPRSNDGSSLCTIQFVISFYFLIATCCWWSCLAHSWYVSFTQLAQRAKSLPKGLIMRHQKNTMILYHVLSWLPGIVFTIPVLLRQEIGAYPIYGICWLSDFQSLFWYLILPQSVSILIGSFFMIRGMWSLFIASRSVKAMWSSGKILVPRRKQKAALTNSNRYLAQMPIFLALGLMVVILQVTLTAYEAVNAQRWKTQLEQRMKCLQLSCNVQQECPPPLVGNGTIYVVKMVAVVTFAWLTCAWPFLSRETWLSWGRVLHLIKAPSPSSSAEIGNRKGENRNASSNSTQFTACTNSSAPHKPTSTHESKVGDLAAITHAPQEEHVGNGHRKVGPTESTETHV